MKKIIMVLIVCLTLTLTLLIGCGVGKQGDNVGKQNNRFELISSEEIKDGTTNGITVRILVDKETKVMYLFTEKYLSGYGVSLEVMVDENGKPLIYSE